MFNKCIEDKDKLIWKARKSEKFLVKMFYFTLKSNRGVFSLKGSVGLLGAFKSRSFCLGLYGKGP